MTEYNVLKTDGTQDVSGKKTFYVPPLCLEDPVLGEELVRLSYLQSYVDSNMGQGNITLMPFAPTAIIQGVWALIINANQFHNGWISNTSNANGDELNFRVFMSAGTYDVKLFALRALSQAICEIRIDGNFVAQWDKYGALAYNITYSAVYVNPTSGLKTLRIFVNGRNPLATGWFLGWTCLVLTRTV